MVDKNTICVGRFAFSLSGVPSGTHTDARFDYVEIEEGPDGITGAGAWQRRIVEIGDLPPPLGKSEVILNQIELEPGWPAIYYRGDTAMADSITLETRIESGGRSVWFRLRGVPGKENVMEDVIRDVAKAYRSDVWENVGEPRFCIGEGAIFLPFHAMESAGVYVRHEALGADISITTDTIGSEDYSPDIDIAAEKRRAAVIGFDMKVLRDQKRTIAGITGQETAITISGKEGAGLKYSWNFNGKVLSGLQPAMNITLSTDTDNSTDIENAWDELLESFRFLPGNQRH